MKILNIEKVRKYMEKSFFEISNKYYDDKRVGIKIVDLFLDLCKNKYFGKI